MKDELKDELAKNNLFCPLFKQLAAEEIKFLISIHNSRAHLPDLHSLKSADVQANSFNRLQEICSVGKAVFAVFALDTSDHLLLQILEMVYWTSYFSL